MKPAWIVAGVGFALAIGGSVVLLTSGSSSPSPSPSPATNVNFTGSAFPNVDTSNTRQVGGPIKSTTVPSLDVAWTLPLIKKGSFGGYSSLPVVANGVIYSQDLISNVQAIALESGEVLWKKSYDSPSLGPNGVVVVGGRVYGATATEAFALDQETGREIWAIALTQDESEGIDMAPGYHDGLVYVSTVPQNATTKVGGGVGTLWALDGKTGKKVWHFDTVPKDLWGNPKVNFGGGLSYTPAFDNEGFMYFGVGSPGPLSGTERYPWGSSRPGPNLYTSSLVKLDAKTGKLQWHYQVTPHAVCDWALQAPPILLKGGGRDLVIATGRAGFVIALDRESGEPVWKRPVGTHNGHDKDGLYAMRGEYSKLKLPMTVYPGVLGGVSAPPSTNGSTVFVPVVNASTTLATQTRASLSESVTGEVVALDAATGKLEWKQNLDSDAAFGATTVANDVVFATTYDGGVYAFDTETGKDLWETTLPAGTSTGVTVNGDMLIAPAGVSSEGGTPEVVAYRLGGAE